MEPNTTPTPNAARVVPELIWPYLGQGVLVGVALGLCDCRLPRPVASISLAGAGEGAVLGSAAGTSEGRARARLGFRELPEAA